MHWARGSGQDELTGGEKPDRWRKAHSGDGEGQANASSSWENPQQGGQGAQANMDHGWWKRGISHNLAKANPFQSGGLHHQTPKGRDRVVALVASHSGLTSMVRGSPAHCNLHACRVWSQRYNGKWSNWYTNKATGQHLQQGKRARAARQGQWNVFLLISSSVRRTCAESPHLCVCNQVRTDGSLSAPRRKNISFVERTFVIC